MRWVEEVFTQGWAYGSEGKALAGRKVVVGITAGAAKEDYQDGRFPINEHDIDARFQATFELCSMEYRGVVFDGGFMNMGDGIAEPVMVKAAPPRRVISTPVAEFFKFIAKFCACR